MTKKPQKPEKNDVQHIIDEVISKVQKSCDTVSAKLISQPGKPSLMQHVQELYESLDWLRRLVRDNRRPPWMEAIINAAAHYLQTGDTNANKVEGETSAKAVTLAKSIRDHWYQITSFAYEPEIKAEVPDFQAIYRKQFLDLQIREKFDSLANQLQALIETDAIESVPAIRRLQDLISLLRKNRNGNFVEVTATQAALVSLKHLWLETLRETPGIKIAVKAAEKAIDELGLDVVALWTNTVREIAGTCGIDPKFFGIPAPTRPGLPAPYDPNDEPIDEEGAVVELLTAPPDEKAPPG